MGVVAWLYSTVAFSEFFSCNMNAKCIFFFLYLSAKYVNILISIPCQYYFNMHIWYRPCEVHNKFLKVLHVMRSCHFVTKISWSCSSSILLLVNAFHTVHDREQPQICSCSSWSRGVTVPASSKSCLSSQDLVWPSCPLPITASLSPTCLWHNTSVLEDVPLVEFM